MNVLITGGNRGLGKALVKVYLANGNQVATIVRNPENATQLQQEFLECNVMVADVTDVGQLAGLTDVDSTPLDLLINNAGAGSYGKSITDTESEEISRQFLVHCLGAFNVTQRFFNALSHSKAPVIINVSSRLGSMTRNSEGEFSGRGFSYGYRIGKVAQNMLTQCLSQELGTKGFIVCAVNPGRLITDSGASDACISSKESAEKIHQWVIGKQLSNGGFYCVEQGQSPW